MTVTVGEADGILRLDRWFRRHYPGLAHGRLEKLLRTGQVKVDGKRAKSGDRVSPGMAIRVPPMSEAPLTGERLTPQARPQDEAALRDAVIHRDDHVIVLNKPPGLAVQGGSARPAHVDGVARRRCAADERPWLVHRLDKDQSGCCTIAPHRGWRRRSSPALSRQDDPEDLLGDRRRAAGDAKGKIDLPLAKRPGARDGGGDAGRRRRRQGRHDPLLSNR